MYINFLRRRATVLFSRWRHTVRHSNAIPVNIKTVLVTVKHELAQTQIYPFYFYGKSLREKFGVKFVELPLEGLVEEAKSGASAGAPNNTVTRVFFQPFLHMPGEDEARILEYVKARFPAARIALMDWFAPLHIRYATAANPFIDVYIKKQTYVDFGDYSKPTIGDTNLNDYYGRLYNIPDEPMQFVPPPGIESKIELGSNFGLSPQMVDDFLGPQPSPDGRDIDLHARIATTGVPWYQYMRREAKDAVDRLKGVKIVSEGRVRRVEFFKELRRSKMCFSPFGYGEVCWRDYEAFATGALLLKPDVGHLKVWPDIFVPGVTFVELAWDLSDLAEKVEYYSRHEAERQKIAAEAFKRMQAWIRSDDCAESIARLCR